MPWIGLILSCMKKNLLETPKKKSNEGAQVKKGLKTPYCRVGERPGLRVYIYICTHLYAFNQWLVGDCNVGGLLSMKGSIAW